MLIQKIISGGQTGVDRAALDVAIALNIPHGGWCPKGRLAEDGVIDKHYQLQTTPSTNYSERTTWNVRDSDGTLIIIRDMPVGGTVLTITVAQQLKKAYLIIDLSQEQKTEPILRWVETNQIKLLNVAGARESQNPGIYRQAYDLLLQLFSNEAVEKD